MRSPKKLSDIKHTLDIINKILLHMNWTKLSDKISPKKKYIIVKYNGSIRQSVLAPFFYRWELATLQWRSVPPFPQRNPSFLVLLLVSTESGALALPLFLPTHTPTISITTTTITSTAISSSPNQSPPWPVKKTCDGSKSYWCKIHWLRCLCFKPSF